MCKLIFPFNLGGRGKIGKSEHSALFPKKMPKVVPPLLRYGKKISNLHISRRRTDVGGSPLTSSRESVVALRSIPAFVHFFKQKPE